MIFRLIIYNLKGKIKYFVSLAGICILNAMRMEASLAWYAVVRMQIIISMQMLGRYYYNELLERATMSGAFARARKLAGQIIKHALRIYRVITFSFREIAENRRVSLRKKWKVLVDLKGNDTDGTVLFRYPICFDLVALIKKEIQIKFRTRERSPCASV